MESSQLRCNPSLPLSFTLYTFEMVSRVKRHDSHVAGHLHDLRCHYSQKGPVIHPLVLTGGEPGQQSSPPLDVRTAVRMFELKTSVLGCSVWEGLQPPPSYASFRRTSLR